jgi:serine/threonine protein kinase/Tol biopolymer transport system component
MRRARSMIGKIISHHRVIEKLGEGGMGVVYKAQDLNLERTVALKFLSLQAIESSDVKERFVREAKACASLDHPNVCTVYEIDEAEGRTFIAMAFIDGDRVADRVAKGPLKLADALDIAIQTVQGLHAAHEKGIVHRDIKSSNLMVNRQGQVKIMDFGIAQLADHTRLTQSTNILGTPAYLSPEQAQRQPTDRRSDIWSLGVVLYELTVGRLPFEGVNAQAVLHSIIHEAHEPVTALRVGIPTELDRILSKALAKNPDERYQHIDELLVDLRSLAKHTQSPLRAGGTGSGTTTLSPIAVSPKATSERRLKFALTALGILSTVVVALLAFVLFRNSGPARDVPIRRFSFPFEPVHTVISPDGRHLAYRSDGRLWVRDLNSETPREIPAGKADGTYYTPVGYYLLWSPDSRELVFPAENELKRVSEQEGGSASTVCRLPTPPRPGLRSVGGLAWDRQSDTIIFSSYGTGIYEVPAHGGSPKLLWAEDHADDLVVLNTAKGRVVLYASQKNDGSEPQHQLVVRTPNGERRSIIGLGTSWPELVYSPTGHILFRKNPVDSASIWALPFSIETLQAQGDPFLVERSGQGMSMSDDGTLVYLDVGRSGKQFLAWLDRKGTVLSRADEGHQTIEGFSLSPDGNRALVVASEDGPRITWIYDTERFVKTRFVQGREIEGKVLLAAYWSRAGNEIYYTLQRTATPAGGSDIFVKAVDGTGEARQIPFQQEGFKVAVDNSTDGRYFVVICCDQQGVNIWRWSSETPGQKGEEVHFSQGPAREPVGTLSPNARFIAYVSDGGGRNDVFVRPFPEGRGRWQISQRGGEAPLWSADGSELFFISGNSLFSVRVSTKGEFSAGVPELLFEHPSLRIRDAPAARYALSADGKRFLMVETSPRELERPVLRIVENWLSEFRRATSK